MDLDIKIILILSFSTKSFEWISINWYMNDHLKSNMYSSSWTNHLQLKTISLYQSNEKVLIFYTWFSLPWKKSSLFVAFKYNDIDKLRTSNFFHQTSFNVCKKMSEPSPWNQNLLTSFFVTFYFSINAKQNVKKVFVENEERYLQICWCCS